MHPTPPAPAPAAADASPVTDDEFATAMAPLGPWDAERRVAVAVSGGPDSLALALLTQAWGRPVALIVDHGLRPEAASEAAATRAALSSRGIHACILRLHLQPGPAVAARARAARYEALTAACRSAGLVDLLLGHHAADQAETVLMRQRRGSGPAGLAGMAALAERHDIRLVRPLLGFEPSRLRDTVRRAGLTPVEDPTNTDLRTTRARLRQEIGGKLDSLLDEAVAAGRHRTLQEAAAARELAACAALYPERFAVLSADRINEASLAALLRSLSGKGLPVSHAGKLAGQLRATTIAGIQLAPAGRLGPGWLLVREASAMAPPMPALADMVWDGRFRVVRAPGGHSIGASGRQASRCRARERLPSAVLRALPALSADGLSGWEPIANIRSSEASETDSVVHQAGLPVAGAPFLACS